jgi:CheY-like chemotaxis protein
MLRGKRILIVDDEPDVLGALEEILDICIIDTAGEFAAAKELLSKNTYDAAILDIMGVQGYDLLEITTQKGVPTLMLTAHALSPDNFVKSIKTKDKMSETAIFLGDILGAHKSGTKRFGKWFARLEGFFEDRFDPDWKEKVDPEFWKKIYYV